MCRKLTRDRDSAALNERVGRGACRPDDDRAPEHFREMCRPEVCRFPTHSAEKRGMDGARKSTVNPKMLKCGESEVREEQPQILRLTTPELKNVRGPVRSE